MGQGNVYLILYQQCLARTWLTENIQEIFLNQWIKKKKTHNSHCFWIISEVLKKAVNYLVMITVSELRLVTHRRLLQNLISVKTILLSFLGPSLWLVGINPEVLGNVVPRLSALVIHERAYFYALSKRDLLRCQKVIQKQLSRHNFYKNYLEVLYLC